MTRALPLRGGFRTKRVSDSDPNPRPFQIRSRRRFRPRSATKMARWGRAPQTSAAEEQKDAERQVDATKRSFKREDRRPGSDPNLPAGLLQSVPTACDRFSRLASTKRPFVISQSRPQAVARECQVAGRRP